MPKQLDYQDHFSGENHPFVEDLSLFSDHVYEGIEAKQTSRPQLNYLLNYIAQKTLKPLKQYILVKKH